MKFNVYFIAKKRKHPPLGLGYIKTYTEQHIKKINIKIIEVNDYIEVLNQNLYKTHPNLIGFSCYENPEIFIELCKKIKNKYKNTITLLGGPAITTSFYDQLNYKKSVDYIIIGEGEKTFVELLSYIISKQFNLNKIYGLLYLKENAYILNPLREPIKDLNSIPSPYLSDIFDLNKYEEFYIEGSRGCLYNCKYCAVTNSFLKYRTFDIKRVIKELNFILKKNPNVKSIELTDTDIFHNIKRAKSIINYIGKNKMKAMFNFNTEATKLNENLIRLISKPNITIAFGIQTLTQKALLETNRFFDIKKIKEKILKYKNNLHNMTQPFLLSCIYGLPGDNFKNFEKTIEFGLQTQARLDFFRLMIWKNTIFAKEPNKYKIKFSSKYPYYITSNHTYSKKDIYNTEKELKNILNIIKLSEKDRFLSEILYRISMLFKKENPSLYTYNLFSSFIKDDIKRKNLIYELLNINRFDYMNSCYTKRFELYNISIQFMLKIIRKHKGLLLPNYYKTVFEISELVKNIETRLSFKKEIAFYLDGIREIIDTNKLVNIKWMDFQIKSLKMINISDQFCDKTQFDPNIKTMSIDELNRMKIKNTKITLFNIFSWLKDKEKFLNNINKEIYIIDCLNSDDYNLLKNKFVTINSFKIAKLNLYICKR